MSTYRDDLHTGHKVPLVENDDILKGAVTTDKLSDQAVTTEKIADEAVTTPKIADGAVTGEKVPDNTFGLEKFDPEFMVTERMIKDQAVTTDKIADDAVTEPKIAPEAVTEPKIKDENVLERHLAPGAVTTEKLAPGMIEKLETLTDAEPTPGSVKPLRSGGAANVYGHYVENPEFLRVITDRNLKMLEATRKQNGNKVLYAGLEVGEGIEAGGDVKAGGDVEAGGSMSAGGDLKVGGNAEVGGSQTVGGDQIVMGRQEINGVVYQVVNSPEWMAVWLDGEGKVLAGFKKDGRTFIGDADFLDAIKANKEAIKSLQEQLALLNEGIDWDALKAVRYIDNPEYICAFVDGQWRVLYGVKVNGDFYFGGGVPSQIEARIQEALSEGGVNGKYVDNPEYIAVWTDAEKRILFALKQDGDFYFGCGVPSQVAAAIQEAIEAERANSPMQYIDDPEERISMELDGEKKILSYRSKDGVKHEDSLEVNHLTLTGTGMTEFQQALKDAGFNPGGTGDWSDAKSMQIAIPRCAMANLTNEDRNATWPVDKTTELKYNLEFWDMQGNYFKKEVICGAQGNTSLAFEKKNLKFDLCNNNGWDDDDTFEIKFGNWVSQDSFHCKAYHTDYLRGSAVVAYQIADEVYKTRGIYADRPWKKALIDFSKITAQTPAGLSEDGTSDLSLQIDNGARCMPDGFPVIFYLNGEFYGIFSWQLKKHRDNYHQNKSTAEHIQLDGQIDVGYFWGGTIDWTQFEVRNPKSLYCMDGSEYDGDNPQELIDTTSEFYDSTNKKHKITAKVKQYIVNLSKRVGEINALNATDITAAKELFDTYFDADNIIDYQLINMAVGDTDGFHKNWQWITYDGVKWYVCQYDKDMSFGNMFSGMFTTTPKTGWINDNVNLPSGLAIRYYQTEHKTRWNYLVDKGVFTAEHVKERINNWVNRIGEDYFKKEWKKWPEAPCNRDSNIDYENWQFTGIYSTYTPTTDVWDEDSTYSVGAKVWFKAYDGDWHFQFQAIKENTNKPCITKMYSIFPKSMGYRDSIWRYFKYAEETIQNQNTFINNL